MTPWFHRTSLDGLANRTTANWRKAMRTLLPPFFVSPEIDGPSARTTGRTCNEWDEVVADRPAPPLSSCPTAGSLHWPNINAMLQADFTLTWSRRAKYQMRLWRTRRVRRRLLDACVRMPFAAALLSTRPRAFHPLMNHLLDRRLGAEARLSATLASVRRVNDSLSTANLNELLTHELTLLTLSDGTRLSFSLSGVSFHEGLWQVGLTTLSGTRLYSLGFGFTDSDIILIANVQGPSLGQDGLALIRDATHAAHGMRPAHLLLHALRLLATHWNLNALFGVDPKHHVKGRWNLRRSRLRFDYRAFWIDIGAKPHPSGNWHIPIAVETRALEAVPAKRRAMYRRRYDMLAQLEDAIVSLQPHADPSASAAVQATPTRVSTTRAERPQSAALPHASHAERHL